MRTSLLIALAAGVVFVAGCGGGGSGNVRPDSTNDPMVEPTPPESTAPIKPVTISQATPRGTSAVDLVDYLKDNASGGPWGDCSQSCWQRWLPTSTVGRTADCARQGA